MSEQDKFNNEEEYHFVDDPELISADDGFHSEEEAIAKPETSASKKASFEFSQLTNLESIKGTAKSFLELLQKNFVLRMTLIGVAILFLILIIYRCTAHHNTIALRESHPIRTRPGVIQHMQSRPQPVQQVTMDTTISSDVISNKKLVALEASQSTLQMQVNELANQVSGVNENVNVVVDNLKQLNEQVTQLAAAMQEQAKVTAALNSQFQQHDKKKMLSKSVPRSVMHAPVRYFLQAVIPGRAWLVDSNGDTFTVRDGSKIANYGMVRYIDAKQGRVLTSSGKIITFSQNDN